MKIPARVLEVVAGPILAAAALGCSTSTPDPVPEHLIAVPPTEVSSAPDPVAYDATAEAERLDRTAELLVVAETRRDQRIEDEEAAERRRRARGVRPISIGIGINPWMGDPHPACGRG